MSVYTTRGVLLALVASSAVKAHTVFSNLFINGEDQGTGNCIRMSTNSNSLNAPVMDVRSNDIVCNVGGQSGVEGLCAVSDGASIEVQWLQLLNDASLGAIDSSHKGGCTVYMKKVDSALEDRGEGDGWFKIYEDGYDVDSDEWCIDKLNSNNGRLSLQIPSGLQGGDYLLRPEIIALHRAGPGREGPEFYLGCAQITIESDGNSTPSETVSIPGYLDGSESGLNVDLYDGSIKSGYEIPGPSVMEDFTASNESDGSDQSQETSDGSDDSIGDGNSGNDYNANSSEDNSDDTYDDQTNNSEDVASGNDSGSSDNAYNGQDETGSNDSTEFYIDEDQSKANPEDSTGSYSDEDQIEADTEGSNMYKDEGQSVDYSEESNNAYENRGEDSPDGYEQTEGDSSLSEESPEYSQSSDSSSSGSPNFYDSGMNNSSDNDYPFNGTDASGQGQDSCNPNTMVTVTVTATASGKNPTDAPVMEDAYGN